jgi:hypothetical protein
VESPEALPLLAYTLWLLYRRSGVDKPLRLAEYQLLDGAACRLNPIQNSVRLIADQAVAGLRPTECEVVALRDAFVPHLVRVRLDDGEHVRQPAQLSKLPGDSLRLIKALVDARLLKTRGADEVGRIIDDAYAIREEAGVTTERIIFDSTNCVIWPPYTNVFIATFNTWTERL